MIINLRSTKSTNMIKSSNKDLESSVGTNGGVISKLRKIPTIHDLPIFAYKVVLDNNKFNYNFVEYSFEDIHAKYRSKLKAIAAYSLISSVYAYKNSEDKDEKINKKINKIYELFMIKKDDAALINELIEVGIGTSKREAVVNGSIGMLFKEVLSKDNFQVSEIKGLDNSYDFLNEDIEKIFKQDHCSLKYLSINNSYNLPIILIEGKHSNFESYIYGLGVGMTYGEALIEAYDSLGKNINLTVQLSEDKKVTERLENIRIIDRKHFEDLQDNFKIDDVYNEMKNSLTIVDITIPELINKLYAAKFIDNNKENSINSDLISKVFLETSLEITEKDIVPEGMDATALCRTYHENSKLRFIFQQEDFMYDLSKVTDELKDLTKNGWKRYAYASKKIILPDVKTDFSKSIEEVILARRSVREYEDNVQIDQRQLSKILYYSFGITGELQCKNKKNLLLRAVPSGGALYPIEIYVVIKNVEDIEQGVYYYNSEDHSLTKVNDIENCKDISQFTGYSDMVDKASVIFILSAMFPRNQWKYKERGYRVMHIDAGHVAQNLHLMAAAVDLASCCVMGFVDNALNKVIGVDGINETSMYMIPVGTMKH